MTKEWRKQRLESGICRDCNSPIVPGYVSCLFHIQKSRENKYNLHSRFAQGRREAERRGKDWCLSMGEFCEKVSHPCDYCEFSIGLTAGTGLDRKDSSLGYCVDNVVSCCFECNTAKGAFWTYEEMKSTLGPAIRKIKLDRLENNCSSSLDNQ